MNFLKKSVIAIGLVAGLLAATTSHSASLDVDVDINVPDMLVLYAYTDIDLDFAAGEFASSFDSNCTTEDCAVDLAAKTGTITAGNVDLNIMPDVGTSAGGVETITLQNSWAVRATGYTTLTASVTDLGSEASVSNHVISPTSPTVSSAGTPGDISFDVDMSDPDPSGDNVISTNYTIEVIGS